MLMSRWIFLVFLLMVFGCGPRVKQALEKQRADLIDGLNLSSKSKQQLHLSNDINSISNDLNKIIASGIEAKKSLSKTRKTHTSLIQELRKLIPPEKHPHQPESNDAIITTLTQVIASGIEAEKSLSKTRKTHTSLIQELRKLIPPEKHPHQPESNDAIITALTQVMEESKALTAIARAENFIELAEEAEEVNDSQPGKSQEIKTVLFLGDGTNNFLVKARRHLESAKNSLKNRDYKYAEHEAEQAEDLGKKAFKLSMHYHIGLSHYAIGEDYTRRKKENEARIAYKEAIKRFKAALGIPPESARANYASALIYHYRLHDTAKTIDHLEKAIDSSRSTKELQKALQELRDKIR